MGQHVLSEENDAEALVVLPHSYRRALGKEEDRVRVEFVQDRLPRAKLREQEHAVVTKRGCLVENGQAEELDALHVGVLKHGHFRELPTCTETIVVNVRRRRDTHQGTLRSKSPGVHAMNRPEECLADVVVNIVERGRTPRIAGRSSNTHITGSIGYAKDTGRKAGGLKAGKHVESLKHPRRTVEDVDKRYRRVILRSRKEKPG